MSDEMPEMMNPIIMVSDPELGTLTWEFSGKLARVFPPGAAEREQNLSNLHDLTRRYMAFVAASLYSGDSEIATRYLTAIALRIKLMADQLYNELVERREGLDDDDDEDTSA